MRRIYESDALQRDDDEPFQPNERRSRSKPQAMRTVPSSLLSRLLVPKWLEYRALAVDVHTQHAEYDPGTTIPFVVEIRNTMPFPITVRTTSPLLWTWDVNGIEQASHVAIDAPDESREFTFDRGERKRFRRNWEQAFRVTESEWQDAEPGEYTIGAGLNVEEPEPNDLYAETTVRITTRKRDG